MNDQYPIRVRFWGTRGSIPTPGPKTVRYGGNTSCVEVRAGNDQVIIFDAGSGIRELGEHLVKDGERIDGHIFLTHFHWDHIQGLPFFAPAFMPEHHFTIYGCESNEASLSKLLSAQMESIYFPVPLRRFGAAISFRSLDEGQYSIEGFRVKTLHLNHPSKTLGYLIAYKNRTIGYLTDNEFGVDFSQTRPFGAAAPTFVRKIIDAIHGADLIIIDAQYTKQEYLQKRGWGHSQYEDVIDIMVAAEVKQFALFHHDPSHSDVEMDAIVAHCRDITAARTNTIFCFGAQEGQEIQID